MSEDQENSMTPSKNGGKPATMDRRNARERNRVRFLNMTFDRLRQHLPQRLQGTPQTNKAKSKKMSKVDTLRAAIDYINQLQEILEDSDAVDAAFKDCDPDKPFDTQLLSPQGSLGSSGSPTNISDEGIGSEEDDLLDVTNWFHC
uniref:Achaete-scute-related gene 1 product n=1 Tax=Platynereis dumerilii TaxID=6359 RepID=B3GVU5_PLADU|nr:achaete-scute-related gene 1 product [Platynereis dumerilii]